MTCDDRTHGITIKDSSRPGDHDYCRVCGGVVSKLDVLPRTVYTRVTEAMRLLEREPMRYAPGFVGQVLRDLAEVRGYIERGA